MTLTKRARAGLAVLMLASVTVALTSAATASAAPAAPAAPAVPDRPSHGPHQNGCSYSPDSGYFPVYYNFHSACDFHDLCYHWHYYGGGSAGRKQCDDVFKLIMRDWCGNRYGSWWEVISKIRVLRHRRDLLPGGATVRRLALLTGRVR